jgi:hypothetical protein
MASLQHDAVPRCGKDLSTSSCLVFVHCKRSQVGLHVMGVTGRQMKSFRRASPQKVFRTRKSPDQGLAGARSSSSRSSLEGNLDAAMLTHAADSGKGRGCSMPIRRTMRRCPKWPRRRRAAEQRDELAPGAHSITSSARASSLSGIVRPSALAVVRLMTVLNFVACSIGISAGLPPLRILSTNTAARR